MLGFLGLQVPHKYSVVLRSCDCGGWSMAVSTAQISLVVKSLCQSVEVCLGSLSCGRISIEIDLVVADWSPVFYFLPNYLKKLLYSLSELSLVY